MRHGLFVRAITPLALTVLAGSAAAQVQQFADWQPIIGNNWFNVANWNSPIPATFPNNTLADTYVVNISGPTCFLDATVTLDKIDVQAGGLLQFQNNRQMTIVSTPSPVVGTPTTGTFGINGGTVEMNSVGNITDIRFIGGAMTEAAIGGGNMGGLLLMSNASNNRIFSDGGRLTFNNGITVEGSGQIGLNDTEIHLNDSSVIRANQPTPLIIDPNAGGFLNNAFLIAENGGTMTLRSGPFTNNGAIIPNTPDATMILQGADITGGQVGGGTGTFELDGGSISGTALVIGGIAGQGGAGIVSANTTIGELIVRQGATLDIENNVSGLRGEGMWDNFGLIRMNSVGNVTDIILNDDILLAGAGIIDMSAVTNNRIFGATGAERLINANNTIRGSGQFGLNAMRMNNAGLIDSDNPGATLTIDLVGNDSFNPGTIRASNEGLITLAADTITQNGGLIEATSNSRIDLNGIRIIGGTLATAGTGEIRAIGVSSRVDGITNNGLITLPNNTALTMTGQIGNNGTIQLDSVGNVTDIRVPILTTFNGNGAIRMTGTSQNRIVPADNSVIVAFNSAHTVRGTGNIGVNSGQFVNNGLFLADEGNDILIVDPGTTFANQGDMQAEGAATLELRSGAYENTFGMIQGTDDAGVRLNTGAVITGGSIIVTDSAQLRMSGGRIIGTMPMIDTDANALIDNSGGGWDDGFTNMGVVSINNNISFDLGATAENFGTMVMNSIGNTTDFRLISDVTLTGGGEVQMNTSTNNRWLSSGGTFRLTNEDNTIRGLGQLGSNAMTLTNQGVVNADNPANTLTIDCAGNDSNNEGVYLASNGATLVISTDTHDQTGGGVIRALDGSTVLYQTAVNIVGGTLESAGSGTHLIGTGTPRYTSVTNDGLVVINNNLRLDIEDSFVNNGTVMMQNVGNNSDLVATSDTTISGTGEIVMNGATNNCRIRPVDADTTLTIDGNTIRGRGMISANTGSFINRGTIDADNVSSLDIDPGVVFRNEAGGTLISTNTGSLRILTGPFSNDGGTIDVPGGRVITKTGDLNQDGGLIKINGLLDIISSGDLEHAGGETVINGSLRTQDRGINIVGGTIRGSGLVDGNLVADGGSVQPGGAPTEGFVDDLSFTGDITFNAGGRFEPAVVNDFISTSLFAVGDANLGGTLDVQFDGFEPTLGERFVVLTSSTGVNGEFEFVTSTGLPTGVSIGVFYFADRVEIATRCGADVNGDGMVTPADFTAWLAFFNNPALPGSERADVNEDGMLTPADFTAWLAAFNAPCG